MYTGTRDQAHDFISKYNAKVTDIQKIGGEMYYTKEYIGKTIIRGEISKENLLKIISNLSSLKSNSNENSLYNLGIQNNTFLSSQERELISTDSTSFMLQGIQNILENKKENIKQTEYRSSVDLMTA